MTHAEAKTIVYGIKSCDTTRKALRDLPGAELSDIREAGLPDPLLDRALERFGTALLNTRSTTWRGLIQTERDRPARELLRNHPLLMKRPLIERGADLYLGWTDEVRAALR